MDQIEKYKEEKATFMADTQQRKQQKLLESIQELEKCRKEIERLRSRFQHAQDQNNRGSEK